MYAVILSKDELESMYHIISAMRYSRVYDPAYSDFINTTQDELVRHYHSMEFEHFQMVISLIELNKLVALFSDNRNRYIFTRNNSSHLNVYDHIEMVLRSYQQAIRD